MSDTDTHTESRFRIHAGTGHQTYFGNIPGPSDYWHTTYGAGYSLDKVGLDSDQHLLLLHGDLLVGGGELGGGGHLTYAYQPTRKRPTQAGGPTREMNGRGS